MLRLALCWVLALTAACIKDVDLVDKRCPCVKGFECIDGFCQTIRSEQRGAADSAPDTATAPTLGGSEDRVVEPAPASDAAPSPDASPSPTSDSGLGSEDAAAAVDANAGQPMPPDDPAVADGDAGLDASQSPPDPPDADAGSPADDELRSLQEIVSTVSVSDQFETALLQVVHELQSPPYTVLIPWDPALEDLPYWHKITQLEWQGHLADFARGHIHQGLAGRPLPVGVERIEMLNGRLVEVSAEGARIRFNGQRTIGESAASDGRAFMLADVLEPQWSGQTVADIVATDERFQKLRDLMNRPELAQLLQALGTVDPSRGVTLFAPINGALSPSLTEPNEACSKALKALFDNHTLDTVAPREFTPTFRFTTRGMGRIRWDASAQTVSCDSNQNPTTVSYAEFPEQLALNGVVHPVSKLLCVPLACQATTPD